MPNPLTFIVETVYPVDARTLVVAPQNEEILRVFDLVREQQTDCLERLLPSIYVVAQKKVVGFWWKPAIFEETQQIVVLAMNIAYCAKRSIKSQSTG